RVSRTIDLIRKGKPQPLYPQTLLPPLYPQSVTPVDALQVQALALDSAMALLHRVLNPSPQSPQSIEMGCYTDIPLGGTNFMAHAHAAYRVALAQKRDPKLRFIDVGCGGGMMVLLATEFFDRAEGYDYDPAYVAAAKRLMDQCGAESCRVFEDNALSFESYDAYDIIYFYQPMQDTDGLETLEARIAQTARPGTILIAPYLRFLRRAEALNCGRIAGAVYVTGTSQPKADLLRSEAERMGPQVAKPPQNPQPHAVEWLGRLAQACAANGYSVRI
ncbi:MAG: class I SAM-dependent methyltransferase, partial [Pseudorhodobacter sp.]